MKIVFSIILILFSYKSQAQEQGVQITTDRPGFSDYPRAIQKGYFQIEAGFLFETATANPVDKIQTINWNNTLLRYGLLSDVELRLGQTYTSERVFESGIRPQFAWQSFSGPLLIGTKINLLTGTTILPKTAILAEYGFNTFTEQAISSYSFYRVQLSSMYQLMSDWYLMVNLGYDKSSSSVGRIRFTFNTGYNINQKISFYAEVYGFKSASLTPLNYFNGGFTYLLNPKFQLDVHAGFDLIKQLNNSVEYQQSFIALGLAYLFKLHK